MAVKKNIIAIQVKKNDLKAQVSIPKQLIGVATNYLEADKLLKSYIELQGMDENILHISSGINDGMRANYHRLLQSMRQEGNLRLIAQNLVFELSTVTTNELIEFPTESIPKPVINIKKQSNAKPKSKRKPASIRVNWPVRKSKSKK